MNRRLWGIVAVVIGLFAGIAYLTGGRPSVAPLLLALKTARPWIEAGLAHLSWPVVGGAAGTAGLLAVTLVLVRRRPVAGHREPWNTVIELGRKGQSPTAIARATGLSQEAVRIVLSPVPVERQPGTGKTFRSNPPGRPPAGPGGRTDRRA